jgi:hypothetical protein
MRTTGVYAQRREHLVPDFSPGNIKPDSVASWLQTKTPANKGAIENVRRRPVVQLQDAERRVRSGRRQDTRQATYNRGGFDIATLAIFPEYLEFEGPEVLRLVVEGAAGRTAT